MQHVLLVGRPLLRAYGLLAEHSLHILTTSSVMIFTITIWPVHHPKALRHSTHAEAAILLQEAVEKILSRLRVSRVQSHLFISSRTPGLA